MKAFFTRLWALLPTNPTSAALGTLGLLGVLVLLAFVFAGEIALDARAMASPWLLLVPALLTAAVMAGGARAARVGFEPGRAAPLGRRETFALGAILVLGATLRFYALDRYPACVDMDTAMNGWISQVLFSELLRGEVTPVLSRWAQGNETAFLYIQGAFIKLLGVSVGSLRLPSAIVGVLTLAVMFLLGRQLFSNHVGLVAAFFTATSPWHIDISRSPKRPVLTPLFIALALYFLCRALQHPPSRRALRDMILCGVTVGVGLHGYEAFRLVPVLVMLILLWVRLGQGQLKKAFMELAVVGIWAMLMTAPIIVFALQHPDVYLHHVTSASAVGQGSPWLMLRNALVSGSYFLLGVPVEPRAVDNLSAPLFAVTPLFLLGGVGLLALRSGPRRLRRINRVALLGTLVVMAAPILLTTLNLAPRRYTGLMVPYYLLAGGAAVGIIRSLGARSRRLALVAGLLGVLLLAGASANILPGMTEQVGGARQTRAATILGWSLKQARHRREVYLSPSVRDNHYVARLYLTHPRLWRLPAAWPLPQGPLKRRVLVVTDGERWRAEMVQLFGAQAHTVKLPLSRSSEDPQSNPGQVQFLVYELDRRKVRQLRVPPKQLPRGYEGWLLVPRPGVYRFRVPRGVTASVRLGGRAGRLLRGPKKELRLGLAGGLQRIRYRPTRGQGQLQWRPPGWRGWAPVPGGQLWRLPPGALPAAPPLRSAVRSYAAGAIQHTAVGQQGNEDQLYLQGFASAGETPLLLDVRDLPVTLWRGRTPLRLEAPSLGHGAEYYRQGQQLISHRAVASKRQGIFLLVRHRSLVLRFDPSGQTAEVFKAGRGPTALALDGPTLYVADAAAGAVLAHDLGRPGSAPATLVEGILPVSVAVSAGRLAVLDRSRHRILLRRVTDPRAAHKAIALPRVDDDMTLTMDRHGVLTLTQPHQKRVLLFSAGGALLAAGPDPCFLDRQMAFGRPVAARYRQGSLIIVGQTEVKRGRLLIGRGKSPAKGRQ